jgi:VanZ family protein
VIQALVAWGPAALWAGVLFLLSEARGDQAPGWLALHDKVAHLGLYAVLGACLAWGRRVAARPVPARLLLVMGIAYGVLDEWHQSFVPGRDPSWGDAAADGAGLLLAFALVSLLPVPGPRGAARSTPLIRR